MFKKLGSVFLKAGQFFKTPLKRCPYVTPRGILIFGVGVALYKIVCIAERLMEAKMAEKGYEKGALLKLADRFLSGEFFPIEPEPG